MNTCIILDGVNGHGVKRMLSTFKEDYNMGTGFIGSLVIIRIIQLISDYGII